MPARHDHSILSFALGTGLRLAEIVDLDVGDVYSPASQPKPCVRIRARISAGEMALGLLCGGF